MSIEKILVCVIIGLVLAAILSGLGSCVAHNVADSIHAFKEKK